MIETKEGKIGFDLGMGWLPDYPDFRDYTVETGELGRRLERRGDGELPVNKMLAELKLTAPVPVAQSAQDLRSWCSPVENQGALGSCTAQAGVALVEYYERKAFGEYIDASRLFVYKTTRNLLGWTGDRGAFIRTTMAALVLFGVPPEEYWPYVVADFDEDPPAFCYAFAQSYQTLQYFRLDPPGTSRDLLLKWIKLFLTAGLPSMFGFTVFSSIGQATNDGKIPYPCPKGEKRLGGHAVVAVGFDDNLKIKNTACDKETTGALLIRNSWGMAWGDKGYGWLPYEYVLRGLAVDWWTLLKSEWVDTGNFGL